MIGPRPCGRTVPLGAGYLLGLASELAVIRMSPAPCALGADHGTHSFSGVVPKCLLAGAGVVYFLASDKREEMLGPAPLDVSHHVQRFKASGRTPLSESEWKLLAGAMFIGGCVLAALMALSGIWVIVIALK